MAEDVVEVEEEEGFGGEVDMVVMVDMVDMETTKKMDGTGIGVGVEVEVEVLEEVGAIMVLDMKEAEGVEEAMAAGGEGWAAEGGATRLSGSWEFLLFQCIFGFPC